MTVSARAFKILRRRKRRKKIVHKVSPFIPFIFTFANAVAGFFSAVKAIDESFTLAAVCIIFACLMDALDGRVARFCKSESLLGAELDGLCDAISFCFAPAILVYSMYGAQLGMLGLFILGLYVCCGLFRLARFNTAHSACGPYFVGLPAPVAALTISVCVLYTKWILTGPFSFLVSPKGISAVIAGLGLLMSSTILFPSFKTYKFKFPYSMLHLIPLMSIVGICLVKQYPILFVLTFGYVLTGSIYYFLEAAKRFLM